MWVKCGRDSFYFNMQLVPELCHVIYLMIEFFLILPLRSFTYIQCSVFSQIWLFYLILGCLSFLGI